MCFLVILSPLGRVCLCKTGLLVKVRQCKRCWISGIGSEHVRIAETRVIITLELYVYQEYVEPQRTVARCPVVALGFKERASVFRENRMEVARYNLSLSYPYYRIPTKLMCRSMPGDDVVMLDCWHIIEELNVLNRVGSDSRRNEME